MERYTDYYFQAAALTAVGNSTDTNCITVTMLSLAMGGMCVHCHQLMTGHLAHKVMQLIRAASAIIQRTATNLARFGLNILAKNLELLLEGSSTGSVTFHKVDTEIDSINAILRPVATKIWTLCDAAYHSHHANVARQRLRHARGLAGPVIRWAIILGVVFAFLKEQSMNDSASLEGHDIQPYVVPAWVVKARPENRPRDGSSSHYQPACIDRRDNQKEGFPAAMSTGLRSSPTLQEHRAHSQSSTLTTVMTGTEDRETNLLVDGSVAM